ncbi:MAG: hypothetical protein JO193_05630 [Candidatus Eremiobacteraeota bacterium]|nr:hypothetical protein [Candidatus Eremiobacteraeota bacterium]
MSVKRALFERLIDYAGLFPPAQLSMQQAAEEYAAVRSGGHAWICGRFIVPVSRITELTNSIGAGDAFALSAIIDAGNDARDWLAKVQERLATLTTLRIGSAFVSVEAIEAAVPAPIAARETFDPAIGQFAMASHNANLRDVPTYMELPRTSRFEELLPSAMFALSRSKLGAKLRCGGVEQSAFPSSSEIVAVLLAAREYGVPFKATAGLHHPIRRLDHASGLMMHGFLNLLAASAAARQGADARQLHAILEERNEHAFQVDDLAFSWPYGSATAAEISAMRHAGFRSYGSCSFSEPVDDLIALDILSGSTTAV